MALFLEFEFIIFSLIKMGKSVLEFLTSVLRMNLLCTVVRKRKQCWFCGHTSDSTGLSHGV